MKKQYNLLTDYSEKEFKKLLLTIESAPYTLSIVEYTTHKPELKDPIRLLIFCAEDLYCEGPSHLFECIFKPEGVYLMSDYFKTFEQCVHEINYIYKWIVLKHKPYTYPYVKKDELITELSEIKNIILQKKNISDSIIYEIYSNDLFDKGLTLDFSFVIEKDKPIIFYDNFDTLSPMRFNLDVYKKFVTQ